MDGKKVKLRLEHISQSYIVSLTFLPSMDKPSFLRAG